MSAQIPATERMKWPQSNLKWHVIIRTLLTSANSAKFSHFHYLFLYYTYWFLSTFVKGIPPIALLFVRMSLQSIACFQEMILSKTRESLFGILRIMNIHWNKKSSMSWPKVTCNTHMQNGPRVIDDAQKYDVHWPALGLFLSGIYCFIQGVN